MWDGLGAGLGKTPAPECAAVTDNLGELALGALSGRDRVAALAHLDSCTSCSAQVEALAAAGDQLLHLAPTAEPPVGFESGVFERLGVEHRAAGRRSWLARRPKLVASMGACALVLAFGLGALLSLGTRGGDYARPPVAGQAPVQVASLLSGRHAVGEAFVYAGNPTWLFMYMDDANWQGTLRCEVVVDRGPTVLLGRFWLSGGKGAWAASLSQPAGRLIEARVVDASGKVLASADLS